MIHEEKMIAIQTTDFRNKVAEAVLQYAKGMQLGTITNTNANVKRFSQIVLKQIAEPNPVWLDGICYFVLSTAALLTDAATQTQINTEVNIIFPHFAKVQYGDVT